MSVFPGVNMGCFCIGLLLLALGPRFLLALIWLFTNWPDMAFKGWMWPLIGWFFMPWTTLVWMGAEINNGGRFSGIWLVLLIIAILSDLSGNGASANSAGRRSKKC